MIKSAYIFIYTKLLYFLKARQAIGISSNDITPNNNIMCRVSRHSEQPQHWVASSCKLRQVITTIHVAFRLTCTRRPCMTIVVYNTELDYLLSLHKLCVKHKAYCCYQIKCCINILWSQKTAYTHTHTHSDYCNYPHAHVCRALIRIDPISQSVSHYPTSCTTYVSNYMLAESRWEL